MKQPLLILGIFTFIFGAPSAAERGEDAWKQGQYAQSIDYYRQAIGHYPGQEEKIFYNLGECFLLMEKQDSAIHYYQKISAKNAPEVASDALSNQGVLSATAKPQDPSTQGNLPGQGTGAEAPKADAQKEAMEQALQLLRQSLRSNPNNEIARYNYELLMKQKQQQEQNPEQNPPPPEENEENQEKENQNSDSQPQPQPRPQENQSAPSDPVDARQADQLMEALKENEKRFLQELKKKPVRQPQPDDRPQW